MRRLLIPALLLMTLAGCGDKPTATHQQEPTSTVGASPTTANTANPCQLITAADVSKAFTPKGASRPATFASVGDANPPITDSLGTRACAFTGTVPGIYTDKPVDGTEVSVSVTTQVDPPNHSVWNGSVQAARTLGQYRPDAKLGGDAFLMGQGEVVVHKGTVVIQIQSVGGDPHHVVTDAIVEELARIALSRVTG